MSRRVNRYAILNSHLLLKGSTEMRKRLNGSSLIEELAQSIPAVSLFPTDHEQIFVDSSLKIVEHCAIVMFISLC